MTLLAYPALCEIVDAGYLGNLGSRDQINATSIDVRLGEDFLLECTQQASYTVLSRPAVIVDLMARESVGYRSASGKQLLEPGQFILAHTMEVFNLPDDISAEFCLKSSMARNGLEHLNACWADAGFNNSTLTLELKNMLSQHTLLLTPGMLIGQLKFFKHEAVPEGMSYRARGRYNGDASVQPIKK